jgi:hypothetical protein
MKTIGEYNDIKEYLQSTRQTLSPYREYLKKIVVSNISEGA